MFLFIADEVEHRSESLWSEEVVPTKTVTRDQRNVSSGPGGPGVLESVAQVAAMSGFCTGSGKPECVFKYVSDRQTQSLLPTGSVVGKIKPWVLGALSYLGSEISMDGRLVCRDFGLGQCV